MEQLQVLTCFNYNLHGDGMKALARVKSLRILAIPQASLGDDPTGRDAHQTPMGPARQGFHQ